MDAAKVVVRGRMLAYFKRRALGSECIRLLLGHQRTFRTLPTSFTTASRLAALFFYVNGAKSTDAVTMNFLRPDGVLYQSFTSSSSVNGSECYSPFINISGTQAASYLGTWTIQVFWNNSSTPLFTLKMRDYSFQFDEMFDGFQVLPSCLESEYLRRLDDDELTAPALLVPITRGQFFATKPTKRHNIWIADRPYTFEEGLNISGKAQADGL